MTNKRLQFFAAFLLFPGMWNMVMPTQTPLLASPPASLREALRAGPREGEEIKAVLVEARFDAPAGLPLAPEKMPRKTIWVLATAYTSSVDETDDTPFITASGTITHPGTVAANFMYFGSRVRIPQYFGDFTFTIEDRMNERYGANRIDIWMPSKAQARDWGARWVRMEVF